MAMKKISHKLILSFLLLIFLVVPVLSGLIFVMSRDVVEQKTYQYISDVLFQASKQIEFRLESVTRLIHGLGTNVEGIQNPVRASNIGFFNEPHEIAMSRIAENAIFLAIMDRPEIVMTIVKSEAGDEFIINKRGIRYYFDEIRKEDVYAAGGSILWYPPTEEIPFLVAAAAVNDLITQQPIGYLVVCINPSYFRSIFTDMQLVGYGETFLVELHGNIMLHDNYDRFLNPALLGFENFSGRGFGIVDYFGENSYVAYMQIRNKNWSLVSIIPSVYLNRSQDALLRSTIAIAIIVGVIGLFIAFRVTKSIVNPIIQLVPALEKIGEGDFTVQMECKSRDEVGILTNAINKMVSDIKRLIDIAYKSQILRQQAEIKSLRMQINPHFLYNTLESINWLARSKGVNEVGHMAKALADLMRATANNTEFVTVREEIKIIHNYLRIQQIRYGDRLVAVENIRTDIFDLYMPKLLIQPILENAFVHGVANNLDTCLIEVRGELDGDILIFEVKDNGMGMTEEKIAEVLGESAPAYDGKTHIGIKNVDRRIKLHYGDEYGLEIASALNVGTTVRITFPYGKTNELEENNGKSNEY